MPQIGSLIRVSDGFRGRLRTLALDVELSLWRCEASGEKAPDYRVYRGGSAAGPEIGAAWKQRGERAGEHLAVVLDDPSFAQPIRATLARAGHDDAWALIWSRPARRQAPA
jgi:uncharacterized protein (DUF736 family)